MNLENDAIIKKDRLRFTKNKLSSNLALLAIVFNAFYFVSIYKSDVGDYYYTIMIGISVLYNLLFMLAAFLSSEGSKNYKMNYSYVMLGLGLGQIVRIFIIPAQAKAATVNIDGADRIVMDNAQYTRVCLYLLISAGLLIAAGVINIIKSSTLTKYQAELENK